MRYLVGWVPCESIACIWDETLFSLHLHFKQAHSSFSSNSLAAPLMLSLTPTDNASQVQPHLLVFCCSFQSFKEQEALWSSLFFNSRGLESREWKKKESDAGKGKAPLCGEPLWKVRPVDWQGVMRECVCVCVCSWVLDNSGTYFVWIKLF